MQAHIVDYVSANNSKFMRWDIHLLIHLVSHKAW